MRNMRHYLVHLSFLRLSEVVKCRLSQLCMVARSITSGEPFRERQRTNPALNNNSG